LTHKNIEGFVVVLAMLVMAFLAMVAYGTLIIMAKESVLPIYEKRAFDGLTLAEAGIKKAIYGLLDETVPPIGQNTSTTGDAFDIAKATHSNPKNWLNSYQNRDTSLDQEGMDDYKENVEALIDRQNDLNNPSNVSSLFWEGRRQALKEDDQPSIASIGLLLEAIENSSIEDLYTTTRTWTFIKLDNMDGGDNQYYDFSVLYPNMDIARVYIARGLPASRPRMLAVALFGNDSNSLSMKEISMELVNTDIGNGVYSFQDYKEELFEY